MKKKTIIEMLEIENKSLRNELESYFNNEHDAQEERRRQIRAAALQMALSFRLGDNVTNVEVLANAASYEQFIGGFDKYEQFGGGQANGRAEGAIAPDTLTDGAEQSISSAAAQAFVEKYPPADED